MTVISWLLGLLTVLGIVALVAGLFGLRGARSPGETARYRWMFGFSVFLLAATAYLGWPGPAGAPGRPLGGGPDVPRAELRRLSAADVALNAVGPSNRSADPRVEAVRDARTARPDRVELILRANNAGDAAALKAQVRRDAWTILRTLYEDSRFDRLQQIVIRATHPSGRKVDAGEPVVAEISMSRRRFEQLTPSAVQPEDLDRVAEVRWFPPLD